MKLSEAIKLGSLLRGQAFCEYMTLIQPVRSCALGAALEAMGRDKAALPSKEAARIWSWAADVGHPTNCPVCLPEFKIQHGCSVLSMITHLNDKHRWTRERIADWVESIEPAGPDQDLLAEKAEVETCCV